MIRVLVTGANSFTGRHLLPMLAIDPRVGELCGIGFGGRPAFDLPYEEIDVRNRDAIRRALLRLAPDRVIHLAGLSSPDADLCYGVNLDGTRHMVEACAALPTPPRLLVVSSSAVYGQTRPEESPVAEETPLRPIGPYGASKVAAETFALSRHRQGHLPVVVARPFNLIGPGLMRGLAPADFLEQALAIRRGMAASEIQVGNLDPRRDFVDVRDVAWAYVELLFHDAAAGGVFNVATGQAVTIRELLRGILAAVGVTPTIVPDPARQRPVNVIEQVGDASRLAALCGWSPGVPLERSLADMAAVV